MGRKDHLQCESVTVHNRCCPRCICRGRRGRCAKIEHLNVPSIYGTRTATTRGWLEAEIRLIEKSCVACIFNCLCPSCLSGCGSDCADERDISIGGGGGSQCGTRTISKCLHRGDSCSCNVFCKSLGERRGGRSYR